DKWGEPVDPQKLEDALKKNRDAKLVAFVHVETSTGCQSDAKLLTQIAHKHGALVIVDAVTSLGGTPVKVDEWEIDAIYSASQKCLSCTPGLSPVSFNERVIEHVKKRKDKIHSWFMDMNLLLDRKSTRLNSSHRTISYAVFCLKKKKIKLKTHKEKQYTQKQPQITSHTFSRIFFHPTLPHILLHHTPFHDILRPY